MSNGRVLVESVARRERLGSQEPPVLQVEGAQLETTVRKETQCVNVKRTTMLIVGKQHRSNTKISVLLHFEL